ncbi:MAG: dihydroorotate dehydrogenase electron transfer subunit [Acidobacteria bacterium]|nr:dihydroorotate dehydrogenase electron transfer subunit [Acidobacteriota bacterium]
MLDTIATVASNTEIAPGYKLLTLNFNQAIHARAGQFAMLKAHDAFEPLLRRALAIYQVGGATQLSFLYQVMGRGTQALALLKPGGRVDALIPLGNGWAEFFDNQSAEKNPSSLAPIERAIVVAGGIGSASVLMWCEELRQKNIATQIFFGAASARVAQGCGLADFRALNMPLTLTTDDGSLGERGFVTAPLERFLRDGGNQQAAIYTCGPWVMMKRVAEIAEPFKLPCFASLEAPMGCGFGVCVGCVVAMKDADPKSYGAYKRVCTDGSIFPAERIQWEVAAMTH